MARPTWEEAREQALEVAKEKARRYFMHPCDFVGSLHHVDGHRGDSCLARHKREMTKWLEKLDRECRKNPSPTFRFTIYPHGDAQRVDKVVKRLAKLGVLDVTKATEKDCPCKSCVWRRAREEAPDADAA